MSFPTPEGPIIIRGLFLFGLDWVMLEIYLCIIFLFRDFIYSIEIIMNVRRKHNEKNNKLSIDK